MAQQKKTDPEAATELPELTDMQMAFVHGLLSGKSAVDSYKDAGYSFENQKDNTLWANASRLKSKALLRL